ncbi:ABC transporter transmembrane region [Propionibacterium acidifaciens F0233]|uniref:ABC transporter transmembrane region n=1 Tax=Propionibacterium acidifaciens F0233 TaxID=553198 RepID=U2S0E5_9ACTN|nr:ABC transporter transmembrane region [Propionibacterium acidifaciens F0233]
MPGPLDPRLVRRAKATRFFLVAVALVGVATALLVLAQARLLSDGVARVVDTGAMDGIGPVAAGLLAVLAARAGLNWLSQLFAHRACSAVKSQLRTDVMRARLALPDDASTPSGTLITLVTQGLDALDGYYSKYLPQLMMAVSVPLVIGVAILTQDLRSALMIAATIPLIPVFMALIGIATQRQVDRRFAQQARLSNHFADLVAGLPTLQVFGRARAQLEGLRITERAHRTETMRTLRLAFLSSFVLELISTLSVALVAVSMGMRVVDARFDLRTSLFVLILTPEVYLPIRQVGVHFHDSADGTAAAAKAFEVIERAEAGRIGGTAPAPTPGGCRWSSTSCRSPTRAPTAPPSPRSAAGSSRAGCWPWPAPPAAASPPPSASSWASGPPPAAASSSAVSTWRASTPTSGGPASPTSPRTRPCRAGRSPTTSASASRRPTTPGCATPSTAPEGRRWPSTASWPTRARASAPASAAGSPWPAPCCASSWAGRASSCSTSRRPVSTSPPRPAPSRPSAPAAPRPSSSRTARRCWRWPTGSSRSSRRGPSRSRTPAPATGSRAPAAGTPSPTPPTG